MYIFNCYRQKSGVDAPGFCCFGLQMKFPNLIYKSANSFIFEENQDYVFTDRNRFPV